jgi:hypothetical protein
MKVSEQIAIMKAYEDGKTIEKKGQDDTEWQSIEYIEDYPFDFVANEYRIKPMDKYRPYESVEEAFNEAKKHGFWIKRKSSGFITLIGSIGNDFNDFGEFYIDGFKPTEFLDKFVWHDDGSPCGVKI